MKLDRLSAVAVFLTVVVLAAQAFGAEAEKDPNAVPAIEADVTQGALRVEQKDGSVFECPLKHTDVVADVSGFIARVKVTQTFHNPFQDKIEAVYVFPLPHGSAVDDMTMVIGDRRIVGLIKKRAEARWIYEYARRMGQRTALLEQERPNIFTQSVANIDPGQEIKIEISYLDVLEYDMGEYTFHFPMVVGPRYNPPGYKGGIGAVAHGKPAPQVEPVPPIGTRTRPTRGLVDSAPEPEPDAVISYLKPGQRTGHDISLSVSLDAGVPVRDMKPTNHKARIERFDAHLGKVTLLAGDSIPNKDFVLKYKVVGEKPEIALLTHSIGQGSGGYYMLMIQPKLDEELKKAPPREICFLIDVSGSMSGKPTQKVRDTMAEFFNLSKPDDTIQVVTFASRAQELFDKYVPATNDNVKKALGFTRGIRGGGGTNMLQGIKKVVDAPVDPKRVRIVVMLSDGHIGNEDQIIKEVADKCGDQIRFWTIGIGSSPNQHLIDGVARQGGGMGKKLGLNDNPAELVRDIVDRIHRAQLANISIDWRSLCVYEVYPMKVPELWAKQPVVLFGRYFRPGEDTIMINGTIEGEPISYPVQVALREDLPEHSVLAQVWARRKIRDLTDQAAGVEVPEIMDEITRVALNYRLMSKYTSFVAVDEKDAAKVTAPPTPPRRVAVPVPMPDGVSFEGVFGPKAGKMLAEVDGKARNGRGTVRWLERSAELGPLDEIASGDASEALILNGSGSMGRFHGTYGLKGFRSPGIQRADRLESSRVLLAPPARVTAAKIMALGGAAKAPAYATPPRRRYTWKSAEKEEAANAYFRSLESARKPRGGPARTSYRSRGAGEDWADESGRVAAGGSAFTPEELVELIKQQVAEAGGETKGLDKISFNFKNAQLKDALTYLSKAADVKIVVDADARDEVDRAGRLTRKGKKVSLPAALNDIVGSAGLRYEIKGGGIHIILPDYKRANALMKQADEAEKAGELSEACAIFKRACLLASASQHRRTQAVADRALSGVLRTRGMLRDEYIKKLPALEGRLDLLIRRKPLRDAITAVSKAGGVGIRWGRTMLDSFNDAAELLELDQLEVTYLDLRNATVAQALDWLLDPFQLEWQIVGEKVTIGTSRRLMKTIPTPWVYQIGFIAMPSKEELGKDKAANRKLVNEAPREILDAVESVIGPGKAELLGGGRLMVYGTATDHDAVGKALFMLRRGAIKEGRGRVQVRRIPASGPMRENIPKQILDLFPRTVKRHKAHAEARNERIAAKQRRAVAGALVEYSWELMAAAMAGEADIEALTYLQFAWDSPHCAETLKKLPAPLAARSLWAACGAARLLPGNAEMTKLAEKAAGGASGGALAALTAPGKNVRTEVEMLEYALAARSLVAAGIKNDKLGDEFLKAASDRLGKAESWVATAARALLHDPDAAAIDALVKKLPSILERNLLRDDDSVVLYSFACRRVGGDAWDNFRRMRAEIPRRVPLSGNALLITNRLAAPDLALIK